VIKDKCTTSKERRVRRWEHEHVLDRVQERLDADPAALSEQTGLRRAGRICSVCT